MEGRKHSPMLCVTRAAEAQAPLLLLMQRSYVSRSAKASCVARFRFTELLLVGCSLVLGHTMMIRVS